MSHFNKYQNFMIRPRGYKTFFMFNSTEHEISTVTLKYQQIKTFLALSHPEFVFIMLINVKMPTIVGVFIFMSSMCGTLALLTSLPIQDGGPHDFRSKMAAPTTPRWRPPRNQDGGPCDAFGYTSEGESTP